MANEIGMDHFALETDSLYFKMVDYTVISYSASKTKLMIGLGVSYQ
jgi:oxygen-independent coproporphyrinogen-3 oxidase